MKSLIRLGLVAMVAALVLAPAVAIQAQGSAQCFGLADADCKLAYGAFDQAQMMKLTSFVMDYSLAVNVKGSPQGDVNVNVKGNGPFGVDMAAMSSASSGSSSNPMAALGAIMAANTIQASFSGGGQSMNANLEWRIVGGTLYFMGDTATQGKWKSVALADAFSVAMTRMSSMGSTSGGASGGSGLMGGAAAFQDPAVMSALSAIPTIPGFIKADAKAGPQIDDQATTQFTFHFDLVTLVKAKEFAPFLKAMLKQMPGAAADITDAQIAQASSMAAAALNGSDISINWLVGTTDKVFHGFGLNIVLHLDATTMAMLQSGSSDQKPIDANIAFSIQLSKVGQPVKVEPAANAEAIDLSAMMGGGMTAPAVPTTAK